MHASVILLCKKKQPQLPLWGIPEMRSCLINKNFLPWLKDSTKTGSPLFHQNEVIKG